MNTARQDDQGDDLPVKFHGWFVGIGAAVLHVSLSQNSTSGSQTELPEGAQSDMGRTPNRALGLAELVVWPMENLPRLRCRRDAGDGDLVESKTAT